LTDNIKATVLQHSTSEGYSIITYELEYPRFIHAELMTHRVFSRNAASSRAIPIERMHQLIQEMPATPVHWGSNQAGMSAGAELTGESLHSAQINWQAACDSAIHNSRMLMLDGLHKQIANRVTEPFQIMKTVVTSTEWANWFQLRNHEDAQPEIRMLAQKMVEARDGSDPVSLAAGEWHVPYVDRKRISGVLYYYVNSEEVTAQQAQKISASCCAQVSYRRLDDSVAKADAIFEKLITSTPAHLSPVEHQATPMWQKRFINGLNAWEWQRGITHMDRAGVYWSANFRGWTQLRQIL